MKRGEKGIEMEGAQKLGYFLKVVQFEVLSGVVVIAMKAVDDISGPV